MVIQPSVWPTLGNEGGKLVIRNSEGSVLDLAIFYPDLHFSLLNSTAGISLERISPFVPGNEKMSWYSASSVVNYATPGTLNSQTIDSIHSDKKVTLSASEFSPDNDGYLDYLSIQYNLVIPDYTVSVLIYSQTGVLVRQLVNNELSGVFGNYIWDGLDENGNKLSMGYYIIFFRAVHPGGEIVQEKKAVLLLPEKK